MTNTTFSVELQGINLPDDVKNKLESELRSVALAEIAKTDLGKAVSVEPLPRSSERSVGQQIFGYVISNVGRATERGGILPWPGRPSTQHDSVPPIGGIPFDKFPSIDALESLYFRPDIRAVTASNTRALAELLSRDEQALQAFNNLIEGGGSATAGTEREMWGEIGAAAVGFGIGFTAGYILNMKK